MSNNIVIDCSFFMSSMLPDEINEPNYSFLDYDIIVPSIFYLECLNALNTSLKRQIIKEKDFARYLSVLHDFSCLVDDFCTKVDALHAIHRLCAQHTLTSYDASYLELAIRLNAKIMTKDNKLISACQRSKITVINI